MARYSKTALYMVKRKDTNLYIIGRAGSFALWGMRDAAMRQLKSVWDAELNIDNKLFRFERVE